MNGPDRYRWNAQAQAFYSARWRLAWWHYERALAAGNRVVMDRVIARLGEILPCR